MVSGILLCDDIDMDAMHKVGQVSNSWSHVGDQSTASSTSLSASGRDISHPYLNELFSKHAFEEEHNAGPEESVEDKTANAGVTVVDGHAVFNHCGISESSTQGGGEDALAATHLGTPELPSLKKEYDNNIDEMGSSKEEFPPIPD
ncbi:hypothetical protein LWI28_027973 [Acer negundo]|uniref:Uncharacterized protein n=1 Tax=Acer negundo TaxID=4023 RepID=A0AAD5P1K6_ACENE|nr:hypothetical protein LWI28_027973 [Acer negundo]KAK4853553.1 hypothetical protein QYF36_010794 [Acer negundo]